MRIPNRRMYAISLVFIVLGLASWVRFATVLANSSSVVIGLEMMLLPAGLGILRNNERWRKISRVLVVLGMAIIVILPLLVYVASPVADIDILGESPRTGSLPTILIAVAYSVFLLGCLGWIYKVLGEKTVDNELGTS